MCWSDLGKGGVGRITQSFVAYSDKNVVEHKQGISESKLGRMWATGRTDVCSKVAQESGSLKKNWGVGGNFSLHVSWLSQFWVILRICVAFPQGPKHLCL